MKNLIDFRKTVEAGVDPRLCLQCFQSSFLQYLQRIYIRIFIKQQSEINM